MAISEKRVDLKTQTTNVATKDFTQIKDNKTINKNEEGSDLLDKIKGSIGDSVDKLSEVKDAVMSGITDAQSGLGKITESIKSGVDQVKGTIGELGKVYAEAKSAVGDVMKAGKQIADFANTVERVCKDPSLSSLSAIGDSLSGITNSIPGLASGPISKLTSLVPESISSGLSSVVGTVGEGLQSFAESSGLKNMVDMAGTTLNDITGAVKSVTGTATNIVATVKESVAGAEKLYSTALNVANSIGIPGVVKACSENSLLEKTGLSKAINNTLNAINGVNSVTTFLETSRTSLADTFSSFSPSSTSKVTEDYSIKNCNYDNKNAASTVRTAQLNIDKNSYTSDDGLFSSKTSTGNNYEWTIASTISSLVSSPSQTNNGVVQKTTNEQLAAVAEITKSATTIENKTASRKDMNEATYKEIEQDIAKATKSLQTDDINVTMISFNKYKTKEPEKVEEKKEVTLEDYADPSTLKDDITVFFGHRDAFWKEYNKNHQNK